MPEPPEDLELIVEPLRSLLLVLDLEFGPFFPLNLANPVLPLPPLPLPRPRPPREAISSFSS